MNRSRPRRPMQRDVPPQSRLSTQDVFSYYTNRPPQDQPRRRQERGSMQPKPNWALWRRLPVLLFTVVIIVCVVYLLTLNPNPKIVPVSGADGSPVTLLRSPQTYQMAARHILTGSALNRTKITIDTGHFSEQMKAQFPELAEVSLTLPLAGHRPVVELAPETPQLILTNQRGSYLVDTSGKAIVTLASTIDVQALHIPTVVDESNVPITVGKGTLTASSVTFITTIVQELQAKQVSIDSMSLPKLPSELHVHIKGVPYYIKFDMNGDARLQAGTFLAVKQKLDGEHITPPNYVDVRVSERAYYK